MIVGHASTRSRRAASIFRTPKRSWRSALIGSTALILIPSAAANAQERVVDVDATLTADDNPYNGIDVTNGASLDGSGLEIEQSSNNTGLLVSDGAAALSGGSITQQSSTARVTGVSVLDGSASLDGTSIGIAGRGGTSALSVSGAEARVEGTGLSVDLNADRATTGSPAAGVYVTQGEAVTSESTFNVSGNSAYGLLASGGSGTSAVIQSTNDTIVTAGDNGWAVFAYSPLDGSGSAAIELDGGSVTTSGAYGYGLLAQEENSTISASQGVSVETSGEWGLGAYATYGGTINLSDVDIRTSGVSASGTYAAYEGHLDIIDSTIETTGDSAVGARAHEGTIDLQGSDIVTYGEGSYGAYASNGSSIMLTGGSVRTLNEMGRETQDGGGPRSYALYANGDGSSISADGTTVETLGQRSYGAYAINGAQIDLTDVVISTEGFMAYGVYASGPDSVINANNVDVETTGQVGDAGWAYDGGVLNIDGGTYIVRGEPNPNSPGEKATGLIALGGSDVAATEAGVIHASGVTVETHGANSDALRAGGSVGANRTSGIINISDQSQITAHGANSAAADVVFGSTLTVEDSTLASMQGAGIRLRDDATISLTRTTVAAAEETFSSSLTSAGQTQDISLWDGSVATENNGTLLHVTRTGGGADGVVTFTLGEGSTSAGDIIDEGEMSGDGGTDVTLEDGASWSGMLQGVRNFVGSAGSEVVYEGRAEIEGDVEGDGTSYAFSAEGASIGGDIMLGGGSLTTGGSLEERIEVAGSVVVDESSTMGGNWAIAGDLGNAGRLSPGNSIGSVEIEGDLTLAPTSVYEVDIDASGASDHVGVGGTATLDGSVEVTPLDGFVLDQPYTILTAGTLAGEFEGGVSFSDSYDFLQAGLAYDPNNVFVTIERNDVAFATVARTANQVATATALDSLALANGLASAVALSATDDAIVAFDQLSGEIHASVRTGLIEESRHLRDTVNSRLTARTGRDAGGGLGVWVSGFGSWGQSNRNLNAAELERNTSGVFGGIEGSFGGESRLGIVGGYSRSDHDIDARASSADIDSYHAGVYGGTTFGAMNLRAGASYSWHEIETARIVDFPGFAESLSADYDAATTQVFGELGYAIDVSGSTLEPFAGLAYVHLDMDDFSESEGLAGLSGAGRNSDATFSTLGMRVSSDFDLVQLPITAKGMVGWRHAFGGRLPTEDLAFAGADAFTASGVPLERNVAVFEAGFSAAIAPGASVGVSYIGQLGNNTSDNGVRGNLSFSF